MKKVLFLLKCALAISSTVNAQAPDTLHFDRLTLTGPGDDGGGGLISLVRHLKRHSLCYWAGTIFLRFFRYTSGVKNCMEHIICSQRMSSVKIIVDL